MTQKEACMIAKRLRDQAIAAVADGIGRGYYEVFADERG
jgi:hypothetical protein